jgi:hypothetical protein
MVKNKRTYKFAKDHSHDMSYENEITFDNVNAPAHYLHGKKETIDVIRDCMTACVRDGRTLNQTIRDARESKAAKHNPYLDDEDMVENKYYQFKGAW